MFVYEALSAEATTLPILEMSTILPTIRSYTSWTTSSYPVRLTEFILGGLQRDVFKPIIDKVFSFDQIVEAHRYMEANGQFGKIVVTV